MTEARVPYNVEEADVIYRIHKRECPFVQIDRRIPDNPGLSWKAKGLLVYLLSKPDNWKVWEKDLIGSSTDGRNAVRSGMKELIKAGYVVRSQARAEDGTYDKTKYDVYEEPQ